MSEDPAEFEKQVLASDKRFEIYVPKPLARINVGKPAKKKHPDGPFGHDGITLSAKDNVFIQAQADFVAQNGKDMNILVGGTLSQYVKKDIQITASQDLRLAAGKRVLMISGAHNDPAARNDNGNLRLQSYNNLAQHYRIDALQVGLFEFFHGRRDRPKRQPSALAIALGMAKKDKHGKYKPGKRKRFDHTDPLVQVELAKDPELQGGFSENLLRTLTALYPAELDGIGDKGAIFYPPNLSRHPNTRAAAQKITKIPARKGLFPRPAKIIPPISKMVDHSDGRQWIEPLFVHDPETLGAGHKGLAHAAFGTKDIEELEWGFSRYYHRFDPYKTWKPTAFSGWAARALLTLQNGMVKLRRTLDCLLYATGLPGALVNMIVAQQGGIPLVGPILGALGATMEAFALVTKQYDQYRETYSDKDTQNPFAQPAAAFAEPFAAKADERKATIVSADGPWDLTTSTDPWRIKVTTETGVVRDYVLDLGPFPPQPAVLTFPFTALEETVDTDPLTPPQDVIELALEIDGQVFRLRFDATNAADVHGAAAVLAAAVAPVATVGVSDETIFVQTLSSGPASRILVVEYEDNDKDVELWPLTTGWVEHGIGEIPAVADPMKVTAQEIAARLNPVLGAVISDVGETVRFTSDKLGNGSRIAVEGNLADKMFTPADPKQRKKKMSDEVRPKGMPDWDEIDNAESLSKPITAWVEWVKSLPDKAQAMFQPLTDAAADLLAAMEALDKVVEGFLGVAAMALELPETPEAVGIFGSQGITLGTQDRIVGSGGHGILFIVDGGSGEADKAKMLGKLEWTARFAGGFEQPRRETKRQSLGFRVLSDSLVDLSAANGAQLLAMGRAKSKENRPHGDKIGGIGVARVLSSWVTEISGNEKVIISARSKGDPSDTDALTGGRVEVAAQTIAIGGVRVEDKDADGKEIGPFDWDESRTGVDAHSKSFGITPVEVETVAMAEHLHLAKQKKSKTPPFDKKPFPHLKQMNKYAWPELLRKTHPPTERVHVHSAKEAVIVVGSFMIHVGKDEGVRVGYRKSDKDPSVNELDDKKGSFTLDTRGITVTMPNKDKSAHTTLTIMEGQSILKGTDGSGDPGLLSLSEGTAALSAGANDAFEVSKSDGLKATVSKLEMTASGTVKIKGSNVNIG